MRVVDTSAWIEWLAGSDVGRQARAGFPSRLQQVVPTIVQYELAVWLAREMSGDDAEAVLADTQECIVVPLDTWIALSAADVRRSHKLATADAIIYATALHYGADLLTCDAHFKNLPHVTYIPKLAP